MAKSRATSEEILASYPVIASNAERMCLEISRQIDIIVKENNYQLGFPIQYRVKTKESIASKLAEGVVTIKSLEQMQDVAGMRITLLFTRDIEDLIQKIGDVFVIVKRYNTQDKLNEDQFGYSSIHLIIRIDERWLQLPTFANLNQMKMEIQIRTLAQHTWAASSHALQYKRESSAPKPLRRSINRIAALLEMVDLELERLLNEQSNYIDNIYSSNTEEINVNSLETLLDEILPLKNKALIERYDDLVDEINHTDLDSLTKLREYILSHLDAAIEKDQKQVVVLRKALDKGSHIVPGIDEERLSKGVFYTHTGMTRGILRAEYNSVIGPVLEEKKRQADRTRDTSKSNASVEQSTESTEKASTKSTSKKRRTSSKPIEE